MGIFPVSLKAIAAARLPDPLAFGERPEVSQKQERVGQYLAAAATVSSSKSNYMTLDAQ